MINSSRLPSRTTYRSFRYSLNRQQNVKTADPSSLPKLRIKKNSVLESTMMRTGGFEETQMSKTIDVNFNGQSTNYIKNFCSLMDSQRKMSLSQKLKFNVKPLKFKIQNFEQLASSQFNLLDPFQRHLKAVQFSCKKAEEQVNITKQQFKLISGELQNVNKKINNNLNDIEHTIKNQLQKLSSLLKQNSIKQQQVKLKFKQEIAVLQIQHKQSVKKSDEILRRNQNLQETIFNCKPYELKQNQQWRDIEGTTIALGIKQGTLC